MNMLMKSVIIGSVGGAILTSVLLAIVVGPMASEKLAEERLQVAVEVGKKAAMAEVSKVFQSGGFSMPLADGTTGVCRCAVQKPPAPPPATDGGTADGGAPVKTKDKK